MHLEKLELIDVRSYQRAQLRLDLGVTVFVGPNAQGKTNIVEAVQRVSTGGSHRSAGDTVLVRVGAQNGAIRAQAIDDDGRTRTIDVALGSGRTQTKVDGHPVRRTLDSIGIIRTVLFAPEDLAIVRGDPSERRAFLDQLLAQRRPAYAAVRAEYERALRQRSQLLKQLRGLGPSARATAQATLDTWSEQLVHHGSQLLAARLAGVEALGPTVDAAYRRLADRPDPVTLKYRSAVTDAWFDEHRDGPLPAVAEIANRFHDRLIDRRDEEIARGVTLVGPHRDDVEIVLGSLLARAYASHGEAWSTALALKLGSAALLRDVGDRPIVLLDDVFAELDDVRRRQLAQMCGDYDQVLVTAAVEADVPLAGDRYDVRIENGVSSVIARGVDGEVAD